MSNRRGRAVVAWWVASALAACAAGAQVASAPPGTPVPPRAPATAPLPPAVATVGNIRVLAKELDQSAARAAADYKARTGSDLPADVVPIFRRQMLESLIRRDLLILEAGRRGLLGSEADAIEQLHHDPTFQTNGTFDPAKFDRLRQQYPEAFANALTGVRQMIGARQLLEKLQAENGPAPAELKSRARRALTRASVEYLVLRDGDFVADAPEPRESDVYAYYRAHPAEFERPARAVLSVVFVDQPALSDSEAALPEVVRAWTAKRRQSADSILAAVRKGASLEIASAAVGGPRPRQTVLPDNFPGYWRGGPETRAAVFAAKAGTFLPEPVPAERGWLVVRVDDVQAEHVAPLVEVAGTIRGRLRGEARKGGEDRDLRALYDRLRDSLAVTGWRVRYALADTGAAGGPPPSAAEIDRYYRAHLADYSDFSSRAGGVVAKSLDQVRDDVRLRLERERRVARAREQAEELRTAWARGKRDAELERTLRARDIGPVVPGTAADTGLAGKVLTDTLAARGGATGTGLVPVPRGWLVFDVYGKVPGYVPTFEQARPRLVERRAAQRAAADEEGGRALFDRDPGRFAGGARIHYTRAFVPVPNMLQVALSRGEVMRYYHEHLDQFSAPELVSARHILISPTDDSPVADRVARARADSILTRLKAGDDFAETARRVTDDPATKESGGDLGQFGRGTMLPEVERAAFALRPGEMSEVVRSSVGYHILKVTEYVPMVQQPLAQIWTDLGAAAALAKADSLARYRADSLLRILGTAPRGRAAARALGLNTLSYVHTAGDRDPYPAELYPYYERLEALKPGQVLPMRHEFGGMGYAITWVDSIAPPARPTWKDGRQRAIDAYRSGAGRRALEGKRAELDSLMAAGWSFDSVAVAWGGLQRATDVQAGQRIPGIGSGGVVDTLVFGRRGDDGQPAGRLSDWIALPLGMARVRTVSLRPPEAGEVATRVETETRTESERALAGTFEALKKRYPVRILDRSLKNVALPQVSAR